MTEEARLKMKTVYDRRARAPKINEGNNVLVKILKFEGKHKIEDRYEDDIYIVVGRTNNEIQVFHVRSDDGVKSSLEPPILLGLIDRRTEDENKVVVDDSQKVDGNIENQGKETRKDNDTGKTAAVADD